MERQVRYQGIPPPPYSERENQAPQFQIRRKPVDFNKPSSNNEGGHELTTSINQAKHLEEQILSTQAARPRDHLDVSQPGQQAQTVVTDSSLVANTQLVSGVETLSVQNTAFSSTRPSSANSTAVETTTETVDWKKTASEHAQKAFQEARYFAGGLIAHPSVSTKHYTILRHSHGVVFYQGSGTFLTVSIFVDEPLPINRTIWMQCKGWSGKTGMRAKAFFGMNDSWINVTPNIAIKPDQVNPNDERAWQRDIKRFRKKASSGPLARHVLRETAIVRVPVEATDGYYQLVLCRGDQKRKALCTSPVFRVISTSQDPSSLRGASLSTLPIELGLWVGGLYAQNTTSTIISPIQTAAQAIIPSKTQTALQTAYTVSGVQNRVDSGISDANTYYDETANHVLRPLGPSPDVNIETGPAAPYPVDFFANMNVQAAISSFDENGLPRKIKLAGIPKRTLSRLDGHYFAWCKFVPPEKNSADEKSEAEQLWLQCIISASSVVFHEQISNVRSRKALEVTTFIKIVEDIDIPSSTQVHIRIMGFMRPFQATPAPTTGLNAEAEEEKRMVLEICDIELARNTLSHTAWQADPLPSPSTISSQRSVDDAGKETQPDLWNKMKDGYTNVRMKGQTMVEQIPLHRAGIRMPSEAIRDKNLSVAGYYISR